MWRIVRIGAGGAGRQAAALFLLAGVLAVAGSAAPDSRAGDLALVAIADFAVAAAAWFLPWRDLPEFATLGIAVAGLAILAFSTWAFGGLATGTGPFFVLLFAWIGLHHPPWVAVALAPLTTASYVAPLVATGQPPAVVSSAVVFVPVTTAVAVVIARNVRQLERTRDRIAAADRWRASLMVTLAHDVRTPLTAVVAALELLEDGDLTPGDRKSLTSNALRQTARITRLAGSLLDVERVEDGTLRLDLREVPMRQAAEDAASLVGVEALIDVEPDLVVRADADRLEQMLVNLTGNAVRHGRPPIAVAARRTDTGIRITVRDHGTGVPEAERSRLFTRFPGVDRAPGSVGLGLWIVRELARAHGGDVHYEPADPGAAFVITLPAQTVSVQRSR
jgi:signal transduction histidine kinase